MDDLDAEVARRVKELRGWMAKGTRPRRTIYLATALYELVKDYGDRFPEASGILSDFSDAYDRITCAIAIFDGKDVTDDPRYQRRRLAFGGGWEDAE